MLNNHFKKTELSQFAPGQVGRADVPPDLPISPAPRKMNC
jgi:hypothetical protein